MKRGLFLKYVVLFVGLVTGVLVINAALDLYFVYQDNRRASIEVQKEKAEAASQRIESFVREIERQIGWVAQAQWAALPVEQRHGAHRGNGQAGRNLSSGLNDRSDS